MELRRAITLAGVALTASAVILFALASAGAESVGPTLTATPESPVAWTGTSDIWRGGAEHGVRRPQPIGGLRATVEAAAPTSLLHTEGAGAAETRAVATWTPHKPRAAAYLAHLAYMAAHPGTGPDTTEAGRQTWLTDAHGVGVAGRASRDLELDKMLKSAGWQEADSPAGLQVPAHTKSRHCLRVPEAVI